MLALPGVVIKQGQKEIDVAPLFLGKLEIIFKFLPRVKVVPRHV